MTTDSPKGPEREARPLCNCEPCQREAVAKNAPISYLRRQVAELVYDALDDSQRGREVLPIHTKRDVDAAADAVVALVQPELERLTAERDEWRQAAGAEADLLDQAITVVSRLREQLAAQQPADIVERAAIWLFRAKTSRLLPDVLQRALASWHQVLDQHDRDAWSSYAREMLMDLGWGVSSSEVEAPQPQELTQHTVRIEPYRETMWDAYCVTLGCGQHRSGSLKQAQDWKDQHEADTLRPKVDFGCVRVDLVSQWKKGDKALYKAQPDDEGEECEVVAVAGDTALVEADPFPFGNPQRWSADVSQLHPLPPREPSCEEVVPEGHEDASLCGQDVVPGSDRCSDHEGRPSGSGAPAPHWREGDIAIDQSNFVHRRFGHGWRTWPRESGLQYGDALMESGFGPMLRLDEVPAETDAHGHVPVLVAERVRAAQAARSEATSEETPAEVAPRLWTIHAEEPTEEGLLLRANVTVWRRDEDGLWRSPYAWRNGEVVPRNLPSVAEYTWDALSSGFKVLTEVPSPSLRKEGEDSEAR